MAILITGGAGFIGFNLAERLLEAEKEVVIFDINVNKVKDKAKGIILEKGDVSKAKALDAVCEKYEFTAIFHLAVILPPLTEEEPYKAFKTNVEGTINVLDAARKYNIKTIIYPSSASVFGPDRTPPFTEEDLLDPWTIYSSFKFYYLALTFAIVMTFIAKNIARSGLGRDYYGQAPREDVPVPRAGEDPGSEHDRIAFLRGFHRIGDRLYIPGTLGIDADQSQGVAARAVCADQGQAQVPVRQAGRAVPYREPVLPGKTEKRIL